MAHHDTPFHIVITRAGLIVVRAPAADFIVLQDAYAGFMTSLGPMRAADVTEMFEAEWPDVLAMKGAELAAFLASDAHELWL